MLMLSKGVGQGAGAQNGYGGYPTKGGGRGLNSASNLFCNFLICVFLNSCKMNFRLCFSSRLG